MLTQHEKDVIALAAKFLELASEEFSYNSCNDLPDDLPDEYADIIVDKKSFYEVIIKDDKDLKEVIKEPDQAILYLGDSISMDLVSKELKKIIEDV